MPCHCDWEATNLEKECGRLLLLLEETRTGVPVDPLRYEHAYKFFCSKKEVDELTEELCSWCQKNDVVKYSLELQIWWRNHQEFDRKRASQEERRKRDEVVKNIALSKLTEEEKEVLGL